MSDLQALLRVACQLSCNPSGLQQALVHGGRNSSKYEERMAEHKAACSTGCDFASKADARVTNKERVKVMEAELGKDANTVISPETVKARKDLILDWFRLMRIDCAQRCSQYCAKKMGAESKDSFKCERSCLVGCDKYFDQVAED